MKSGELKVAKRVGLSDGLPPNRYDIKLCEYSSMKSGDLDRGGWADGMSLDDNALDRSLSNKTSDTTGWYDRGFGASLGTGDGDVSGEGIDIADPNNFCPDFKSFKG